MGKEVHCYSVPDYASAALAADVEDIFAQSAAARALGPRSRVLVKPNLVAKHAPEKAVTTHPAVLDAVCAALRRRGVESITVADSPGGLYNPAACWRCASATARWPTRRARQRRVKRTACG